MDYSKLSDFEINAKAAAHWLGKGNFGFVNGRVETFGGTFDPCNNPADAWPIIQENGISVICDHGEWAAFSGFENLACGDYIWSHIHAGDTAKPLRSGMIVYLMMQEGGE